MAKGAQAKQEIFNKILATFPDSFMQDDKILRIPYQEGNDVVEIKVTLTAAKDIIGAGAASAASQPKEEFNWSAGASDVDTAAAAALTDEEKDNVKKMMEALGL